MRDAKMTMTNRRSKTSAGVLTAVGCALLAGTATLCAALGAVMFFSRNVDWDSEASHANGSAA